MGIHAVRAALQVAPGRMKCLIVAEEGANRRVSEVVRQARELGVDVQSAPRAQLDRRADGERHQDLMALFDPDNIHSESELDGLLEKIAGPPFILVLDGVQDPHNLGACLRSAAAAGAHFVILTKDRSVGLTAVARRAASGAAESLPLLFSSNLARTLRALKKRGVWLVGATQSATQGLFQRDLTGPLAIILGSEGKGMRRLTEELCDYLVNIPMQGNVTSLNVSVATGVCLFEAVRQRQSAIPE